jgi:NADPH:quinone reductase-like Zn-dependent oxidoreductase
LDGGINYKSEDWHKAFLEAYGEMNLIIDSAGGATFAKLLDIAAPAARIVFYGGGDGNWQNVSPQKIFWKQLSIMGSTMGSDEEFAQMIAHINTHQIHPLIDSVFPIEQGAAAFQRMAAAEQFGKIVIRL